MPNKNYLRGVAKERAAKKELEEQGAIVTRASGSHGVFDLVAFFPDRTLAIQCKRFEEFDKSTVKETMEGLNAAKVGPGVTKQLWIWLDRKGWRILTCLPEPGRS